MSLFLHGLAPEDLSPATVPHQVLPGPGFVALASTAPEGMDNPGIMAELALRHNAILTAWAKLGPVLPLRFGTVFSGEGALSAHLQAEGARLRDSLHQLGDAQEYVLRLRVTAEPVVPEEVRPATGRAFLARGRTARDLRRETVDRRRAFAQGLLDLARPLAREVSAAAAPRPDRLLDAALLLDRPRAEPLFACILPHRSEATALGLDLTLTGPWPAYGFLPEVTHVG